MLPVQYIHICIYIWSLYTQRRVDTSPARASDHLREGVNKTTFYGHMRKPGDSIQSETDEFEQDKKLHK